MRKLVISILATAASFYTAQYFLSGVQIESTWSAYFFASIIFVIFNFVLSPIIKILLLPINLLTLGLLRWISNVLVLYLFDLVYDGINISGFSYQGMSSSVVALPATYLSLFWVLVLASFIMSLTYSLISALFRVEN